MAKVVQRVELLNSGRTQPWRYISGPHPETGEWYGSDDESSPREWTTLPPSAVVLTEEKEE